MEDSEGSDPGFSVLSESFQLLDALAEVETEEEKTQKIREYVRLIEKEDPEECPEFYEGLEWFNISTALSLKNDLAGKLVVLDFFTYCCINCMHILPDLHRLEEKFSVADGLVVVGVHSAKFENEKVSSNILSAVLRYGITHPVVNDSDAHLWHSLSIQCWPTLVLVAPNGRVLLHLIGEGHSRTLEDFVRVCLNFYQDRGEIVAKNNLPIKLSKDCLPASPLLFPGKIALDESGKRLAIADTGHHRIIVTDLSGVVQHTIGCGNSSLQDGDFIEAGFNAPQGLVWKKNLIFVADTENHAIRQIDLDKGDVVTLTGTGRQGFDKDGGKLGRDQEISSPWDVTLGYSVGSTEKDILFIAMAGTHQIWLYFLEDGIWLKKKRYTKGTCVRFAGNGAEENRNNNYPHAAAFAQPSGLTINTETVMLYLADSESSTVRSVSLVSGAVKGVVGGTRDPRNLFAFGDQDGKGIDAKLQHPLAVCLHNDGNTLYVADSYNHKIKTVDLETKECRTLLGRGRAGNQLGPGENNMEVNEPGGLCVHTTTGDLYIADTNNHSIKIYSPGMDNARLTELPILFPEGKMEEDEVEGQDEIDGTAPSPPPYQRLAPKSAKILREDSVKVAPGSRLTLHLAVQLGEGLHPTEGAPMVWQISVKGADGDGFDSGAASSSVVQGVLTDVPILRGQTEDYSQQPSFPLRIPSQPASTADTVTCVEVVCYYCDEKGACRMQGLVFEMPLVIDQDGEKNNSTNAPPKDQEHTLTYSITLP